MNIFLILLLFIENLLDGLAVKKTNFRNGKDFEKVAQELGI